MEKTFELGKVDYNETGCATHPATLEVTWDGTRFSVCGSIWQSSRRDIVSGGQNVEEVAGYFPDNATAQTILRLWREWHLNDLTAGSPAQEAWLKANPIKAVYPESHYEKASAALAAAGINPDPGYIHNGKPYKYGHAWLLRTIPADVVAEIESLFAGEQVPA